MNYEEEIKNLNERVDYFSNEIFRTATLNTNLSGVTKAYNTIRTRLVTDDMVKKFITSLDLKIYHDTYTKKWKLTKRSE